MSTVALSMIVKDEFDSVVRILDQCLGAFDEINIVVSDKTTANKLKKVEGVNVKWRSWTDDFAAARNVAKDMCSTDYMFWLDADDAFDFRQIPSMVAQLDSGYDAIFLPYNYAQDENGNCVVRHWRERMVRLSVPFEWRGRVHESLISDTPYNSFRMPYEVKHLSNRAHESLERNHKILEKAFAETGDPRYQMYLGMSHFTKGNFKDAITILTDYIEVGGNIEDVYRSLCLISESYWALKDTAGATEFALRATLAIPEYPMAYWLLAQYEAAIGNKDSAVEWIRTSESKPDPQTLAVWDPTSRDRARLLAATALYESGKFNDALAWIKKIKNPALVDDIYDTFVDEADKETFVNLIPRTRKFYKNDEALWQSLSDEIKYDGRVKPLRYAVTAPKKWDDKSIVIFCGQGYEEWGPHTLDKGMGGSEEAVVYLSRELAKLGWCVTVYADSPEIFDEVQNKSEGYVNWLPWQQIDTRDEFNVFVGWRAPQFTEKIKAKVKIVDLHDVVPEEVVTDQDATYFVKSKYHRDLYKHLPDEKFVIVGNGIKKEQFSEKTNN